jgi:hypothetical protein
MTTTKFPINSDKSALKEELWGGGNESTESWKGEVTES